MAIIKVYVGGKENYELRVWTNGLTTILHMEDPTRLGSDIAYVELDKEDVVSLINDLQEYLKEMV